MRRPYLLPIIAAVAAGIMAFLIAGILPKIYKSNSALYFPNSGDPSNSLLGSLSAGLGKGNAIQEKGGQVSLFGGALVSPQVASGPPTAIAVISSLNCRKRVAKLLDLPRRWNLPNEKTWKKLDSEVSYSVDKNGLLALECADYDRQLSADILNAYIKTLKNLAEELSLNLSTRNRKFLEGRLAQWHLRMQTLESKLKSMSTRDPDTALSIGATSEAAKAVVDLESELTKTRVALEGVNGELAYEQQATNSAVKSGADLPKHAAIAGEERRRVSALEYQFSLVKAQYGPDNPQYRLLDEQLKMAKKQLQQEIDREGRALSKGIAPEVVATWARRASLEVQVDTLDRALKQVKSRLRGVPLRQLEREHIQQELKSIRSIIELQEMEAERARVAETRDTTTFEVIDPPDVQSEPAAPRRMFVTGLASAAGLLLGIAWLVAGSVMRERPAPPLA
jgi:uncharacterized protein involved in exopolysaccharide biosynthesis